MLSARQVEQLNDTICGMDRDSVVYHLQHFQSRFPLDFTPKFFNSEPIHRLRHILFGLCLHNQRTLDIAIAA